MPRDGGSSLTGQVDSERERVTNDALGRVATVLVVSTDAETYSSWLNDYDVRTVRSPDAVTRVAGDHVDVVLVDDTVDSSHAVLDAVRVAEYTCRVVLVSGRFESRRGALEAGYDYHVTPPATATAVDRAVSELVALVTYEDCVDELYDLTSRLAELDPASDRYARLEERIAATEACIDTVADEMAPWTVTAGLFDREVGVAAGR